LSLAIIKHLTKPTLLSEKRPLQGNEKGKLQHHKIAQNNLRQRDAISGTMRKAFPGNKTVSTKKP